MPPDVSGSHFAFGSGSASSLERWQQRGRRPRLRCLQTIGGSEPGPLEVTVLVRLGSRAALASASL
ncbi:MAG: hypothetical protein DWQ36_03590 [Acidobacteria bacterium]|nr:MAG: hypothetical protein DWQ30_16315 [Acidobacteriota bacterium]REK10617.1 MAG: hypothetical protein DWQ36_03590 [Acidobacteriota bacterium]